MLLNVWLAVVPFIFCAAAVFVKLTTLEPGVNVPPHALEKVSEHVEPTQHEPVTGQTGLGGQVVESP